MSLTASSARRWILAAAIAGVGLRAAFGLLYWVDKPLTHDEREYLALARSLTDGRGFAYDETEDIGTGQRFGRAPGYPLFLALIGAGRSVPQEDVPAAHRPPAAGGPAHGAPPAGRELTRQDDPLAAGPAPTAAAAHSPARVKIAQAFVGGAAIWLVGVITWRAAGPLAGVLGAAIAAVYPPLVWTPAYVFSETLYSVLALLTAHTLQLAADDRAYGQGRRGRLLTIGAGVLAGAAILTRPAMLFFLPLAVIWLVARRQVMVALVFVAVTAAVLTPWTVRNVRAYDRFVLVASEGGVTFWTGNHPLARGEGDLAANPGLKQAELDFRRAHPGLTPEELEPLYYRDALRFIADDPLRWAGLIVRKAFYSVVPVGPSYTLHSTRYWLASVISYLLLLPPAVVGLWWLWHSERRPASVLLLGASAVLVGLVFFPQERFRIPVIDPVLIIGAAAAIARSVRGVIA